MKCVKMQGGLGNQLFCLAFAHSVSGLTGEPVGLDVSSYRNELNGREFEVEALARRLGDFPIVRTPVLGHRILGELAARLAVFGAAKEGQPPSSSDGLSQLCHRPTYFNGYWQNEAFIAYPETIRSQVGQFIGEQGGDAPAHDLVVHFRTHKQEKNPRRKGIPQTDYYRRAIEEREARLGSVERIVLISDDTGLAMECLRPLGRQIVVPGSGDAYHDAVLMLRARSLVLTNSSFSWWGGYCSSAAFVAYPTKGDLYHYSVPATTFHCL
jgi:hypothetical protein